MLISDPETRRIPVIFLTSSNKQADHLWAKMQGGKDLIGKPYQDEQILDKINVQVE